MRVGHVRSGGQVVTHDGESFFLDGERIDAVRLMEYDRLGDLAWEYDGLREWVQAIADRSASGQAQSVSAPSAGTGRQEAPIAYAIGRIIRTIRRQPGALLFLAVVVAVLVLAIQSTLPDSPEGIWVARLDNGDPFFIMEIGDGRYSIYEVWAASTFERGSARVDDGTLTLHPEWTSTDEVDFWGAGHMQPFTCEFSVRGGTLRLSGSAEEVIKVWERYE